MKTFLRWIYLHLLLVPGYAFAQISLVGGPCSGQLTSGQVDAQCVIDFIAYLIQQVFAFSGGIALIVIMWGGFEYTLGQLIGGKEKGQERIRNGILGLVLSGFSFFIMNMVRCTIILGSC